MRCADARDGKAGQSAARSISGHALARVARPAWIVTKKDPRRPALRGILHGGENWKSAIGWRKGFGSEATSGEP